MAQDPSSGQEVGEPQSTHHHDPRTRWWKQPVDRPQAYRPLSELPLPPWTLRISFTLWLVAALPAAMVMAANQTLSVTHSATSESQLIVGSIIYFVFLSIFPVKMQAGRQWARVWLLIVCAFWSVLWIGQLGIGLLLKTPTYEQPLSLVIAYLIGLLFGPSLDERTVALAIPLLVSGMLVIMIGASILMFRRPSNEFFHEVRATRQRRRTKLEDNGQ